MRRIDERYLAANARIKAMEGFEERNFEVIDSVHSAATCSRVIAYGLCLLLQGVNDAYSV
jgi:hypothetical protein